jgi:hypothetical protein
MNTQIKRPRSLFPIVQRLSPEVKKRITNLMNENLDQILGDAKEKKRKALEEMEKRREQRLLELKQQSELPNAPWGKYEQLQWNNYLSRKGQNPPAKRIKLKEDNSERSWQIIVRLLQLQVLDYLNDALNEKIAIRPLLSLIGEYCDGFGEQQIVVMVDDHYGIQTWNQPVEFWIETFDPENYVIDGLYKFYNLFKEMTLYKRRSCPMLSLLFEKWRTPHKDGEVQSVSMLHADGSNPKLYWSADKDDDTDDDEDNNSNDDDDDNETESVNS